MGAGTLLALITAPRLLFAQQTTTNCDIRRFSYANAATVNCTSSTVQNPWATFAKSFQESYERAERAAFQRRQLELLEQQNRLIESSRAASEARLASEREEVRREARERGEAAARLFWRRAGALLEATGDSLSLDESTYRKLVAEAYPILQDVFVASPTASNAEIADNLLPVIQPYRRRSAQYDGEVNGWISERRLVLQSFGSKGMAFVASSISTKRQAFLSGSLVSGVALRASLQSDLDLLLQNRSDCQRATTLLERWIAQPPKAVVSKPDVPSCRTDLAADEIAGRWIRTFARADSVEGVRLRRSIAGNLPRRSLELNEVQAKARAFAEMKEWGSDLVYIFRLRVEMAVRDAPATAPVNVDRVVSEEGIKLQSIIDGCLKGLQCERWTVDTATYRKFREAKK